MEINQRAVSIVRYSSMSLVGFSVLSLNVFGLLEAFIINLYSEPTYERWVSVFECIRFFIVLLGIFMTSWLLFITPFVLTNTSSNIISITFSIAVAVSFFGGIACVVIIFIQYGMLFNRSGRVIQSSFLQDVRVPEPIPIIRQPILESIPALEQPNYDTAISEDTYAKGKKDSTIPKGDGY